MIRGSKKLYNLYIVPDIIEKNTKNAVLQKTLYSTEYHLFFSQLHVILFFF